MAEKALYISQQQTRPIKVTKWKVTEGSCVPIGRVLLLYEFVGAAKVEQRRLKVPQAGTVHKILAQEDAIVQPGENLCEMRECTHPTIMNEMCADCGTDLRKNDVVITASVPMIHAIPDLKVSQELAEKLGKADSERLIKDRKLVLLVDLDQTLIHTTNDNIPPNIKDVYHFQLYGSKSPWYHTRLRPRTHEFLENISPLYELHICTFGARNYAHMIAAFLDPVQKFFSNRILSRDECFDPTSKKANLKALFPCGDNMVCIIDDREDVWSNASNLIHVKPYHFFQHTGDINAPPGLDKLENDSKGGVDLSKAVLENKNKDNNSTVEQNEQNLEKPKDVNGDGTVESEKEPVTEVAEVTDNNQVNESTPEEKKVGNQVQTEEIKPIESANVKEQVEKETSPHNKDTEKCPVSEPIMVELEKESSTENKNECKSKNKEDNLIEIDDPDDYLHYLEDVLKKIHQEFYEKYDKMESGEVPDLKTVIPFVRSRVLEGCKLVFSGLVPTHIKLEQSKAYQIAKNLGAEVTQELEENTTHLVAIRPGTAKVNAGKRKKSLKIVTPDWLWCCAERWEHINEKLFPLSSKGSKNRHPPPHCNASPEHLTNYSGGVPAMRKQRTPSGRFMDTINPLMSFSSADIADMDKEVEDILDDESDTSSSENEAPPPAPVIPVPKEKDEISSTSSSEESLTAEYPKGFKRKREESRTNSTEEDDVDDEIPSVRFKRGETVDDDLDIEPTSQDSDGSIEEPDDVDDGEWNMMGAALEREFLSNN